MERFRIDTLERCWPDLNVLFEAHRGIVDAILAGEQVVAEDAARTHLDAVWYRIAATSPDAVVAEDRLDRACAYIDLHLVRSIDGLSPER
jgi:DNA-binding GntR family transcriptional regulator